MGLFLLCFFALSKRPLLELSVEGLLYVCAALYFIKRRRYKRTGSEKDKPSKFLEVTAKILIILGIIGIIFAITPLIIAIFFIN